MIITHFTLRNAQNHHHHLLLLGHNNLFSSPFFKEAAGKSVYEQKCRKICATLSNPVLIKFLEENIDVRCVSIGTAI